MVILRDGRYVRAESRIDKLGYVWAVKSQGKLWNMSISIEHLRMLSGIILPLSTVKVLVLKLHISFWIYVFEYTGWFILIALTLVAVELCRVTVIASRFQKLQSI